MAGGVKKKKENLLVQFHVQEEFSAKSVNLKARLGHVVHLKRPGGQFIFYNDKHSLSYSMIKQSCYARINPHLH